jgi:tRNA G46 methylase TrmB
VETLAKHIDASATALMALEVASGGGAHVTALAKRFPNVSWQPTDIERTYLARCAARGGLEERVSFLGVGLVLAGDGERMLNSAF